MIITCCGLKPTLPVTSKFFGIGRVHINLQQCMQLKFTAQTMADTTSVGGRYFIWIRGINRGSYDKSALPRLWPSMLWRKRQNTHICWIARTKAAIFRRIIVRNIAMQKAWIPTRKFYQVLTGHKRFLVLQRLSVEKYRKHCQPCNTLSARYSIAEMSGAQRKPSK